MVVRDVWVNCSTASRAHSWVLLLAKTMGKCYSFAYTSCRFLFVSRPPWPVCGFHYWIFHPSTVPCTIFQTTTLPSAPHPPAVTSCWSSLPLTIAISTHTKPSTLLSSDNVVYRRTSFAFQKPCHSVQGSTLFHICQPYHADLCWKACFILYCGTHNKFTTRKLLCSYHHFG
jgi:hypothetical protein